MRQPFNSFMLLTFIALLMACSGKQEANDKAAFTEIDTLRETYLILEDSMLATWNAIARDESEKMKAMHELLNSLGESGEKEIAELKSLQQRLEQLEEIKLTQSSIEDTNLVDEYDFTSNSLVSEIITLTESAKGFQESEFLQEWVDRLKIADQHIEIFRTDYDSVAVAFNRFLEKHQDKLIQLDEGAAQKKRPLF